MTLTCGAAGYNRRRFVPAAAVAALLWALYAFFVGRIGGHVFTDRPWLGLLVALGIVLVLMMLIETVRRATRWRHGPAGGLRRLGAHLAGCDLHPDSTAPAPGGDTGAVSYEEKGDRRVDHAG